MKKSFLNLFAIVAIVSVSFIACDKKADNNTEDSVEDVIEEAADSITDEMEATTDSLTEATEATQDSLAEVTEEEVAE